jgi:hypothetical protein
LAAVFTVMVEMPKLENWPNVTAPGHKDEVGLQERLNVPPKLFVLMSVTENVAVPPGATVCAYGVATIPAACDEVTVTARVVDFCKL